jgi:hypothetical protein
MPKCFAAVRTVAPVSMMYTARSQARCSIVPSIIFPPYGVLPGIAYEKAGKDIHQKMEKEAL